MTVQEKAQAVADKLGVDMWRDCHEGDFVFAVRYIDEAKQFHVAPVICRYCFIDEAPFDLLVEELTTLLSRAAEQYAAKRDQIDDATPWRMCRGVEA